MEYFFYVLLLNSTHTRNLVFICFVIAYLHSSAWPWGAVFVIQDAAQDLAVMG